MNIKSLSFLLAIAVLISGCKRDPETRGTKRPEQTITLEKAQQMYQAYQERFNALTEFRGGKEDARYGWHSIDFYKDYISYLEAAAEKVDMKISGLRMYYVAYPEQDVTNEQRGYQSYIFVPTYYDDKTGKHIAFDPLYMDDNGKPLPIHDIITKGTPYKKVRLVQNGEEASSLANMAQMCKPNCLELTPGQ